MMPAGKHFDPVTGIDVHIVQPPGPVPPLPVPHPFIGILIDPMDYAPFIGATVKVNGIPRAQAGTSGKCLPVHVPLGGVFVKPPANECEMFMGSSTVSVDGDAFSYLALPALSCQDIGMPPIPRLKKKSQTKSLVLPTSLVLPIPGAPVLVGGPPTISLMGIAQKLGMAALGKAFKKLRKLQKGSKRMKALSDRAHAAAKKAMDKLGVPPSVQNKVQKGICTVTGHPVDVATGKVFTDNVDFEFPGPLHLKWERTWFSTSIYSGPLGNGWHHSYDMALVEDENAVAIRMADGRPAEFPRLAEGDEHFDRKEKLTLGRDDQGYVLRTKDRLAYRFSLQATAKGVHPLASVSNASGHRIEFSYDGAGSLSHVTDSANRTFRVNSDTAGRILSIDAPHPEKPAEWFPLVRYEYDSAGCMANAFDALGYCWSFQYRNHLLIKETNRNGLSFHFEYDTLDAYARCTRTWGDGGIYDHSLSYDHDNCITTVTDSLGNKTLYHWDGSGLVVKKVEPNGGTVHSEFNEFNELVKRTDALGQISEFAYDDRGNRIAIKGPSGVSIELRYEDDLLVSASDPLGGQWKWEYDHSGNLLRRTDSMGQMIEFTYSRGLLVRMRKLGGAEVLLTHDSQKRVSGIQLEDGSCVERSYDRLGRCTAMRDPAGKRRKRTVDLAGRPVAIEQPDGSVQSYGYDPEGNLTSIQGGRRNVKFGYSGLNRTSYRTEDGKTVKFLYDYEERLIGIENEQGDKYTFVLDANGEMKEEVGFDGVHRYFTRDLKGRIIETRHPDGCVTKFTWDASDRVVAVDHGDGLVEQFEYRPDGRLMAATTPRFALSFQRDLRGKLLKEIQGDHWVASTFDNSAFRIGIESSLGTTQTISRSIRGKVSKLRSNSLEDGASWFVEFKRDVHGLEVERVLPGGLKASWNRDSAGRPTRQKLWGPRSSHTWEYCWEAGGKLHEIRDSVWGDTQYMYDALGNLVWSSDLSSHSVLRIADEAGNIFSSENRSDRVYSAGGRLLKSMSAEGKTQYRYDGQGNLVGKSIEGGGSWTYHWNRAGLLSKVVRPDGLPVEFAYDALGRRVSKTFGNRVTYWVWDGNVPLHEWTDLLNPKAEGATLQSRSMRAIGRSKPITWIFKPESFVPLAKLADGKAYSILTNPIGAPVALCDQEGHEVWSAKIDIYGKVEKSKGQPAMCPFRFPGQYEDVETGLYYNKFRYYDPGTGRYISQDPLKIRGGTNPYAYSADPLTASDPFGLSSLFRGDDGYTGGDMGRPLGSDADIKDPWDHVRRESTESSAFTSFSETNKSASKFTEDGNVFKVDRAELEKMQEAGEIKIHTPEDVRDAMKVHPDKKVRKDANNVYEIMKKNDEVLVEGVIPENLIKKCK
jgi:RHS repeat-associated protein